MQHFDMLDGARLEPLPFQLLGQNIQLPSEHDGYVYLSVSLGDTVHEGQELGHVADFRGNVIQSVLAPADGIILTMMSTLAINKGETVLTIGPYQRP
jgi:predicted deacylase